MNENPTNKRTAQEAQLSQAMSRAGITALIDILAAMVVVAAIWGMWPAPSIVGWFAMVVVIGVFPAYMAHKFSGLKALGEGKELWMRWMAPLTLSRGMAWGLSAIFIFPYAGLKGQFVITFIILVLAGQMVVLYPMLILENLAFSVPAFSLTAFKLASLEGFHGYALTVLIAGAAGLFIYSTIRFKQEDAGAIKMADVNSLFLKLLDHGAGYVFVVDPKSRFLVMANETLLEALGRSGEGVEGLSIDDLGSGFPGEAGWGEFMEKARRGEEAAYSVEIHKPGADGVLALTTFRLAKVRGGEYLVCSGINAPKGQAAMEEAQDVQHQLSLILESIPLSIMILNSSDKVLYFNLASTEWYGIPGDKAVGQPEPDIWFDSKDKDKFYAQLNQLGYVSDFEARHRHPDGNEEEWALVSGVRTIYNGEPATMVTRRRITAMKEAEQNLRAAKKQAEEATELKDQFVSIVSHDLRTPLGAIQGLLGLLNKREDMSPETVDQIIGKAINATYNGVSMVDKLLDISRLKTGKIVPVKEMFSARNFVEDYIEGVDYLAEVKGITIRNELSREMIIFADRGLFSEVINNLLSNAVKFCRKDGVITIFNPEGEPLTLAFKDNGMGMGSHIKENIFKHEVKTTTPGADGELGTGLGLPYCNDIMKAHGGTLSVESEVGEGSVFYVRLPAPEVK